MKRPKIVICRHAESLEDVDKRIYDHYADLEVPLTEKGIAQALDFGLTLMELLNGSTQVNFYTSPGIRNIQTLKLIMRSMPSNINVNVEIEPLIVKQDWGKITGENRPGVEAERYKTGVLRYKFPTGESAASLLKRLSRFKDKIFEIQTSSRHDIVVLSHGFEFRVLLMLIMGWEEEFFESLGNLKNCEHRVLTLEEDGRYSLDKPLRQHGLQITRLLHN